MCGFKVGDEVVCVDARNGASELIEGRIYTITRIVQELDTFRTTCGLSRNIAGAAVWVDGGFDFAAQDKTPVWAGYGPSRFRKVQRRNLQEWLSQSVGNTDKLDERRKVGA